MTKNGSEQREPSRAAQLTELGDLAVSSDSDGDVRTISLFGELDIATADGVERELERAEATDARTIILDLSGLTFISSTGIALVLSAHARSRAAADRLTLLRGPASVQRVFELSGVDDLLPFAE
ncbi:MAG: STAS domain-containing protein [Actinomycetota bacterium]|nr:STAS domain-containing protein [Actinomycetota bacterium]